MKKALTTYIDDEVIKRVLNAKKMYEKKVSMDLSVSAFISRLIVEGLDVVEKREVGRSE